MISFNNQQICDLKFMLPFRHIGEPKADQWLGLLDGLYAIAMTLLAMLLPDAFEGYLGQSEAHGPWLYVLMGAYNAATYFFVFLMMFECWCCQRAILVLADGVQSRFAGILNGLLLALVCLVPAWIGFAIKAKSELIGGGHSIEITGHPLVPALSFLLGFLAYEVLVQLASRALRESRNDHLRTIQRAVRVRSLLLAVCCLVYVLPLLDRRLPEIPTNLILALYITFSFNQDRLSGRWQRLQGGFRSRR